MVYEGLVVVVKFAELLEGSMDVIIVTEVGAEVEVSTDIDVDVEVKVE